MGELLSPPAAFLAPGEAIQCQILQRFPNMIVVSFEDSDNQTFQGALLLSSRNLESQSEFKSQLVDDNPRDYRTESFFSTLSNRHTYFNQEKTSADKLKLTSSILQRRRQIRLRARQVLCHSCKSVCSENGRSVSHQDSRASKALSDNSKYRGKLFNDLCVKTFTLVPKLKRLQEKEIKKFEKKTLHIRESSDVASLPLKIRIIAKSHIDETSSHIVDTNPPAKIKDEKRSLRRKRSVIGSMEDLWDETIFDQEAPKKIKLLSNDFKPAEGCDRASKKAVKRAKREAKKLKKLQRRKQIHAEVNKFSISDVVWANLDPFNDQNWWPAKILAFSSDSTRVKLFGPSADIVVTKRVKPLMELIDDQRVKAEAERHPSFDSAIQLALRYFHQLTPTIEANAGSASNQLASPVHCVS